jgi:PAS domain S-box-containing protein
MPHPGGSDSPQRVEKFDGPRGNAPQLAKICMLTVVLMTLYETAKTVMAPHISLWASHIATIVLTSLAATAMGYFILQGLQRREDNYRRLIEQSPDPIWVHQRGIVIIANRACADLFGAATPDLLVGRRVLDFLHPDERDALRTAIEDRRRIRNPIRRHELRYVRLDGSEITLEVAVCTILYGGEPSGLVIFRTLLDRDAAEQRLRESEATLAAAQKIAHLGSWTAEIGPYEDIDKNPTRWSDEIYRIIGYEVGGIEATRPNFIRAVHPADRERIQAGIAKAIRDKAGFSIEYRVVHPDGSERNVQGIVDVLCDARTGKPMRLIGTIQDITERKRAIEKLGQLAMVIESSGDAITSVGLDGRISSWNKGAERIYGYTAAEAIGQPITILAEAGHPEEVSRFVERLKRGEAIESLETVRYRKGGQPIDVSLTVWPVRDPGGRVVATAAVARDITARKEAEERFYKAFHLNPEPITLARLNDGRYLDVNESFLRITGYKREEVIGRTSLEIKFWEKPEDRARFTEVLGKQGSVRDLEVAFRTKSGERRIALDSADVIEVNGQTCVIAILKDITDRKSLESQLRQLQKMEAIGQLSGGVAHDFNNLLSVILGYSEMLETGLEKNPKLRKTAQEITKAGQRAASLTRQLLAFSRQQVLEPKVLNLNAVVSDTKKMLRRLIGEHIAITSNLAPDLGPVVADRVQMEQVIMNLAVNARDAMPNGGKLTIETRNVDLDEEYAVHHPPTAPGQYVELVMADTGAGMDAQTLSHIFEPFFTTKEVGKGTGLGLATVYGVVKQSGGYIWVYSEPGLGTTFKVYLPRVTKGIAQNDAGGRAMPTAHGTETILLVEDEESLRTLTRTMLEQSGYTVLEAGGGLEAVEVARNRRGPIDLLLTDIVMPGINGREVARNLTMARPGLKVLFMSGYSGFASRGHDAQEDALLSKPFTRDDLLAKIHDALHLQKSPVA